MLPRHDRPQLCRMLMRSVNKGRGNRKSAGSLSSAELMHVLSWVEAAKETLNGCERELNLLRGVMFNVRGIAVQLLQQHPHDYEIQRLVQATEVQYLPVEADGDGEQAQPTETR